MDARCTPTCALEDDIRVLLAVRGGPTAYGAVLTVAYRGDTKTTAKNTILVYTVTR